MDANNVQWGRLLSDGRIVPGDFGVRGFEYARDDVVFDQRFGLNSKLVSRVLSDWEVQDVS